MEYQSQETSRKNAIVERFVGGGLVIGVLLGIVGLVQIAANGDPVHHVLILLGIVGTLGMGVGWLVGNAVAWMIRVD